TVLARKTEEVPRGSNRVFYFDRKSLEDAWLERQKIEVGIAVDRSRYVPGEPIGVQITATGLGFLWIQELNEQNAVTGEYPPLGQEGQNLVGPAAPVVFPNQRRE